MGRETEQKVLGHYILYRYSETIRMETLKDPARLMLVSCQMETFLKQHSQ